MSNDIDTYQLKAARTLKIGDSRRDLIIEMALGLAGETGEIVDHLKKIIFQGHDEDRGEITEEIGDVMWYLAGLATIYGIDLSRIADFNIEKLKRRYPEGFSTYRSINR